VSNTFVCYLLSARFLTFSRWRLHRRIFHQTFHQAAAPTHHAVLLRSVHKMLFSFLHDPTNYDNHFQMSVIILHPDTNLTLTFIRFTASFILSIVYAYEAKDADDHTVHIIRRYLELVVVALGPVATVVMEAFPFRMLCMHYWPAVNFMTFLVLHLPAWFPGSTFKRASVKCLQAGHDMKEIPFRYINERMVSPSSGTTD